MNNAIHAQQAILEVLTHGECYGTGIRDRIRECSKDAVDFGPGTLYPALRALQRAGLVTSRGARPKVYYKLTRAGAMRAASIRATVVKFYSFKVKGAGK